MTDDSRPHAPLPLPLALVSDLAACLRFYSRLPVPVLPFERDPHAFPDFDRIARVLPLAAALIGLAGALPLFVLLKLGLPSLFAAALAIGALCMATGAFHEDGLADMADGFGGGRTRERKLEIMKDSRIGTFGGAALTISLVARIGALAALAEIGGAWGACLALIAAGVAGRSLGLLPLVLLPPARSDGAAFAEQSAGAMSIQIALGGAAFLCLLATAPAFGGLRAVAALALAGMAALVVVWLSQRHIEGQTGDVAGAAEQMAEIGFFCGLLLRAAG